MFDYSSLYFPRRDVKVIKKDGKTQKDFDINKIIIAIGKSASRINRAFTQEEEEFICNFIVNEINDMDCDVVPIITIHNLVEKTLDLVAPDVAKSYRDYRNYKQDFVGMFNDAYMESQQILFRGDKENANTDSSLVATKRTLTLNGLEKRFYAKFFMLPTEEQARRDGYIYVHDMSSRRYTMNCCLADIKSILAGGFEMGNVWYNEPKTLDVAFDVIGDITMSMAGQQYGGFTLPEVDSILAPYAEKSYKKYYDKYYKNYIEIMSAVCENPDIKLIKEKAHNDAMIDVAKEMEQGFQGWEYKFNTVSSSRGDYPFITISLGLGTSEFEKLASITALQVRMGGQGKKEHKKPVLFPKIVFLYDKELHEGDDAPLKDVYEAGIACSAKTMYPDWLSLTGEGYVPEMYKKYKRAISPMGCVDGKEIITYRYLNNLYVESFERMWSRLSDNFEIKHQYNNDDPNLYMDLINVEIFDTEKGFVNTKRIIRNTSNKWLDVHFSNGRRILCTNDHPFEINQKGIVKAEDLSVGDSLIINSNQANNERILFNADKAWLLGFILCDGCYQNNNLFASVASEGEDEIEEKFISTIKTHFELEVKTVLQRRGKKGTYKDLIALSNNNGGIQRTNAYLTEKFGGVNKSTRHIPNEVFEWNYESKLAFLAGMIDADGYINPTSHGGSVVQIGSTNKELALQQMALAQSLGMPAKIYYNHYTKKNPNAIRYRVEFYPIEELLTFIICEKKKCNYNETKSTHYNTYAEVIEVIPVEKTDYSYDVTTESGHFEVSGIYSHNCRAFLSPWYEKGGMYPADEDDKPVFIGRFNIGAISLNLPMIYEKARREERNFYDVLEEYLQMIRRIHIRTYDYLGSMKASINPLGFCEGGFYGGHLNPSDKIKPLLKPMTASFGVTALNELQRLHNGKSLVEDGKFALDVMKFINNKINEFKQEDGYLYAIYGTPAENLCGLQVKQFREKYGFIENVSDKDYVSNSFHCHVSEDICPTQKQDLEGRFWNYFNGGKIQYVRYPINYNTEAIKSLVKRAMDKGFYEGVNLSLAYCDDCGHQELEMNVCPKCGSSNLTKIDRMNGYLAYSRVHGDTRLNAAKMSEIADRKSM